MGQRILLDTSPTGVQHIVDVSDDELITIEHTPTSIESEILDGCARLRSMHQRKGQGGLQHAARIPINTYMAWKKEWAEKYSDKYTWSQFEVMRLNSADFCKLRTGYKRGGEGMKL